MNIIISNFEISSMNYGNKWFSLGITFNNFDSIILNLEYLLNNNNNNKIERNN